MPHSWLGHMEEEDETMGNSSQNGPAVRQLPDEELARVRQAARESVDRIMVDSEKLKEKIREAVRPSSSPR